MTNDDKTLDCLAKFFLMLWLLKIVKKIETAASAIREIRRLP